MLYIQLYRQQQRCIVISLVFGVFADFNYRGLILNTKCTRLMVEMLYLP